MIAVFHSNAAWRAVCPVRVWRHEMGVTPPEAGAIFGVSRGAVLHWEEGRTRPTKRHMAQLEKVAGIDAELMNDWLDLRPRSTK